MGGGGEENSHRAGVNEEPLQEAVGSVARFGAGQWYCGGRKSA